MEKLTTVLCVVGKWQRGVLNDFYGTIKAVQSLVCILTNLALALAFVQAPFAHVHRHENTERHSGAFFHSHFGHIETFHSTQLRFCDFDPDDDAQFQTWFSLATSNSGFTPLILPSFFFAPAPQIVNWRPAAIEPSAHGPPLLNAITPRAPPA